MTNSYDFIVVGAGPAGCAVARRLADTAGRPSVLLLEAGSDNRSHSHYRSSKLRFLLLGAEPKLNWNFRTAREPFLNNRKISQARGKGLGGTSAINFSIWLVGSGEDYNEWAALTGDNSWQWSMVQKRLRKIENVHQAVTPEPLRYLGASNHSESGKIDLSYPRIWDPNVDTVTFSAAETMGLPLTSDLNSGDPVGIGLAPISYMNGARISAAEAYLTDAPSNLTILSDAAISKVLFKNKRAIGVLTVNGQEFLAKHEVILSAGTLNTPQILMLSGIGPSTELTKHNIRVIHSLPGVGQHLLDHLYAPITHLLTPSAAAVANPKDTSPLHEIGPQCPCGFLRVPSLPKSPEFNSLPPKIQSQLSLPTVPHYELMITGSAFTLGSYTPRAKTDRFRSVVTNLMNLQSQGSVTLSSSDPTDPPVINGNYLSHPFDRRLAIESLRAAMEFQSQPAFTRTTQEVILAPQSLSDDHLLDFWRKHGASLFHMGGTVKMGRSETGGGGDEMACLDPSFRVRGVQGLRVVDMSVAPTLPCNHTQSTAYLIGETAAEKLIEEYGLDRVGEGFKPLRANL